MKLEVKVSLREDILQYKTSNHINPTSKLIDETNSVRNMINSFWNMINSVRN
jgi:hypothetical protein